MQFPSRRARIALLAGCTTLGLAAPASADPVEAFDAATGKLTVTFSSTEDVELTAAPGGKVVINDVPGTTDAAAVKTLEVRESDTSQGNTNANAVDLSAVTAQAFTQLTSTLIRAEGGADTLTGTQLNDRIEGGRGNDVMNGRDGDDTTVWNPGEGSDDMNGGDGIDTVENNGGNGPETFETNAPTPTAKLIFKRTAPAGAEFDLEITGAEKLVNNMAGGDDVFKGNDLATLAATINGGDGNDDITGTTGADTLNGNAGNDRLVGARGNDAHAGGDGDDLMIWNPGDGSDKMDGEAGNDVAQDNGGTGVDNFIVTAQAAAQRVTATRDNVAPFFLDIGTTETLDLNGNGGNDIVDVNPGLAALIKVDVDLGDGDDTITARNDSAERIEGGAGNDSAQVDATDTVANVESVDAPAAADTTKPQVTIVSKRLKVANGRAAVKVSCPQGESSCDGRIKIKRGGNVAGAIATKLAGGQTKTYRVQLNRATRIALAKADGKQLAVTLVVTATDAAGNKGKVAQRIKLKG